MENDDKFKLAYEHSTSLHKYFLNWRYSLIAGFIVIIAVIGHFNLTLLLKSENYSLLIYVLPSISGIIITIFFFLINKRITELIWKCQNSAYLNEKKLGFEVEYAKRGLYGNLIKEDIRRSLDDGEEPPKESFNIISLENHSGILNCFFIIVFLGFMILLIYSIWTYIFILI